MRVKTRTLAALTADDNGIALAQNTTAGTPLTLEAGAASLSPPRQLSFDAAADISGIIFTVVGKDRAGNTITETVTGVTTTPVSTVGIYASVTSITPDTTDGVNSVFVGWTDEVISAPIMLDHFRNPFNVGVTVDVTGTVSYTVEHTQSDLQNAEGQSASIYEGLGFWLPHATLAAATTDGDGNYAFAVEAIRVRKTGTGSIVLRAMQSGVRGA